MVVYCDASRHEIGRILSQYQEHGMLQPVAYVSRGLRNMEGRCSVLETELLSVVCTVTYFRPFLKGRHFIVFKDHAASLLASL